MVSKHFFFSVFVVLVAMGTGTNAAMKALRRGKDVDTDPSVIPQLQKVAPRRRRLNGDGYSYDIGYKTASGCGGKGGKGNGSGSSSKGGTSFSKGSSYRSYSKGSSKGGTVSPHHSNGGTHTYYGKGGSKGGDRRGLNHQYYWDSCDDEDDDEVIEDTWSPTYSPTEIARLETSAPTYEPTDGPTSEPTAAPTYGPTYGPTDAPSFPSFPAAESPSNDFDWSPVTVADEEEKIEELIEEEETLVEEIEELVEEIAGGWVPSNDDPDRK